MARATGYAGPLYDFAALANKMSEYWKRFWSSKDDPLHRGDTDDYYKQLAAELLLLISPEGGERVFEVGCGNGSLFELLGFSKTDYAGVDLSEAMVERFRSTYPQADVRVGSVSDFPNDEPIDLVFSNGVMQYLSPAEYEEHIKSVVPRLSEGGQIVHAAIPWDATRWSYMNGDLGGPDRSKLMRGLVYLSFRTGLRRDNMGTWHNIGFVSRVGSNVGLEAETFGSLCNPYRFHVRYRKPKS